MLTVSYIVSVFNKSRHLKNVLAALEAITGDFKKEYIFINNGSSDSSLAIIEETTKDWKNVTIIDQKNQGTSSSVNAAIKRCNGDYVHFVNGDDVIEANSTSSLLKALMSFDCEVALSNIGSYDPNNLSKNRLEGEPDMLFIGDPLKDLLLAKISWEARFTNSLIKRKLLLQIEGCDERVTTQGFSLFLRCAKLTKFIKVNKSLCYRPEDDALSHIFAVNNFEEYQNMLTLFNFIRENPEVCNKYSNYLFKALWSIVWKIEKTPRTFAYYVKSRLDFSNKSWEDLIKAYEFYLETFSYANQR